MGALKGFGWFRPTASRRVAQQDPAEMGTAFGLDASFAATPPDIERTTFGDARPGVTPLLASPPSPGFWRRLGGRLAPGR